MPVQRLKQVLQLCCPGLLSPPRDTEDSSRVNSSSRLIYFADQQCLKLKSTTKKAIIHAKGFLTQYSKRLSHRFRVFQSNVACSNCWGLGHRTRASCCNICHKFFIIMHLKHRDTTTYSLLAQKDILWSSGLNLHGQGRSKFK